MAPVMKRPSSSKAKAPAMKVAKKVDPIEEKVSVIQGALGLNAEMPASVVDMLVALAPESLAIAKDERHQYQNGVVEMIGQALKGIEKQIQEDLGEAESTVGRSDEDKASREAAVATADGDLNEKRTTAATAKSALADAALVFRDTRATLRKTENEQETGDADLEVASSDKERLEAAVRDIYEPLKETAATNAQVKQLQQVARDFSFDSSLISALSAALTAVVPRSSFANVVLQQLAGAFTEHMAARKEILDAGAPAKAARAVAVQAAQEALEAAKSTQLDRAAALKAAQGAENVTEGVLKAAKKSLSQLGPEIARATARRENDKARLAEFQEQPLAAFYELVERTSPPEEPEEEEEEAATATVGGEAEEADVTDSMREE